MTSSEELKIIKKLVPLVSALAAIMIFSTGAFADAVLKIGFYGPYYIETDLENWNIDPSKVPGVSLYKWYDLTEDGRQIPEEDKEWLFHADQDLSAVEFTSNPKELVADDDTAYFTEVTTDPTNDKYLLFSGGSGISTGTYFGIRIDPGPGSIKFHPTPIPSTLLLLGAGLVGLVVLGRRRL